MRVAFLLEQCLSRVPGGTGRYSKELASALAQSAPQGSSISGWTAWHRNRQAAHVPGVGGPHSIPLPARALIASWEKGIGPGPKGADIIHAPTLLIPPKRKSRLVVTIHDAVPWTHPETLTPRGVHWHQQMAQHAVKHADRIVVPTHAVATELSKVLPSLGSRIAVVGEGVTSDLALPADSQQRAKRLQLPEQGYIVSLATLEPRKGLDVLIAAMAEMLMPEVPLLIVGQPGWGGVDPLARAAELGLPTDRVRVLGRISDADLAVVLDKASVLVAPSRAEGFGLPALEAMAAGVPVITSDAPALVEVGGDATVVVPRESPPALAKAIREVLTDSELRARMIEQGRIRSSNYTWKAAATALWNIYGELVKSSA